MPTWNYGITTVLDRRETYFPSTLSQLEKAGFPDPIVFCDGLGETVSVSKSYLPGNREVVFRPHRLGAFGNWILALWELYIRNPKADRYAIFQDDILCTKNLRQYLDSIPFPEKGYWNLFTFLSNEEMIAGKPIGFHESEQYGRGALGLVFNREGVVQMLGSRCTAEKPRHATRGDRRIDGAVVTALSPVHKQPGGIFKEYVHNPSLLQHAGDISTLRNHHQPKAKTFPGEEFDCLTLLPIPESQIESPLNSVDASPKAD